MHWNVQGLVAKIDEIQFVINELNIVVFGICEHWLNSSELADEY